MPKSNCFKYYVFRKIRNLFSLALNFQFFSFQIELEITERMEYHGRFAAIMIYSE